jgi:integrase
MTDTAISAAAKRAATEGRRIGLVDAVQEGLWLRVTPAGARSWVLGIRDTHGAQRRFPLGSYPAMGISDAREAARAMRAQVRAGADPIAESRRKRAAAQSAREGIGTLAALLALYGEKAGAQRKSWPDCQRRIGSVFKPHLAKPLAALKASDLQMTVDAWPSEQSASAAVRYIRPVLKWAAQRGYCDAGLAGLHQPATVGRRERVLSRDELAAVLPMLMTDDRPYARAMRFMLLTLARREEVCAARWRDVNFDAGMWTIPTTKSGRAHTVQLSGQALCLLRSIGGGEPDALIFATGNGTRLANWDKAGKAIHAATGTSGWTRHDLRRTGATMLGDMGIEPHIIEAALNHAAIHSQLASTYNRSRYQQPVAMALQRLADALDGIATGGAVVVPIRGGG